MYAGQYDMIHVDNCYSMALKFAYSFCSVSAVKLDIINENGNVNEQESSRIYLFTVNNTIYPNVLNQYNIKYSQHNTWEK